jgi:molybdopterin-binding protein
MRPKARSWRSIWATIDTGGGNVIASSITRAAVKNLKLKKGAEAVAVIKAGEVIIGIAG